MNRILYISYDGMTDPLGQSQVLPYIVGLSRMGYKFTLLSAEKPIRYEKYGNEIKKITEENGIEWETITFSSSLPIISKIKDLISLKKKSKALMQKNAYDMVHCRSYVSTQVGLMLHKKFGVSYLFDMRGFWVNERVDSGNWNRNNPFIKIVFRYYKRLERLFLTHAAHVISLSEAGKREIGNWDLPVAPEITVIPCSADFELFNIPNGTLKEQVRTNLGLNQEDLVISYLGSIGAWYLLDEMLDFFHHLKTDYPSAKMLFITPEDPEVLKNAAMTKGIDPKELRIVYAKREEVSRFMAASDLSVFFIKPCFSKIASSPTKLGEILAMGIPVIANSRIGDIDLLISNKENGYLIDKFDSMSYKEAVDTIPLLLKLDPEKIRNAAFNYYDLQSAIESYGRVYENILS